MIQAEATDHETVARRLSDVDKIQEVLKEAAHQAVVEHQRSGRKIVVWRDNCVVWEEPTDGRDGAE